eukprot:5374019-Pleurochrysis_carterae.AAC.1
MIARFVVYSQVKPYWSAACYVVSRGGAARRPFPGSFSEVAQKLRGCREVTAHMGKRVGRYDVCSNRAVHACVRGCSCARAYACLQHTGDSKE